MILLTERAGPATGRADLVLSRRRSAATPSMPVRFHLELNAHTRERQLGHCEGRPDGSMVRSLGFEHVDQRLVGFARGANDVGTERIDGVPASGDPCCCWNAFDVLECVADLKCEVLAVEVARVIPPALAGTFDNVPDDDGLRVAALFAVCRPRACLVVVSE